MPTGKKLDMTDDERKAYQLGYQRGYHNGSRNTWPQHRPPLPPDPLIRRLIEAAQRLRDGHDMLIATTGPDDDLETMLGAGIDGLDAVLRDVTDWLRERPT